MRLAMFKPNNINFSTVGGVKAGGSFPCALLYGTPL